MASVRVMQGRQIGERDVNLVRDLWGAHPDWNRTRLSRELRARWDWPDAQGQPKDMAARTLLLKLERAGYVQLPARRGLSPKGRHNRDMAPNAPPVEPIRGALRDLRPLRVNVVAPGSDDGPVQRPAGSRALPRPSQHRRREASLPRAGPARLAGRLRAVRLGGVDVRGARCVPGLGPPHARTQPARAPRGGRSVFLPRSPPT